MKKQRLLTNIRTPEDAIEALAQRDDTVKRLYLAQDMTAREVCTSLGIPYSTQVQKYLHREHPKNKGHGGARPGSGNKKGIRFCGYCRRQLAECICEK